MKKCLLVTGALCFLAWPVASEQVTDVVVFGDSLSDRGNIPILSDGVNFPPSPPYVDNRFSNGPVYSELLPGLLGATCDPSLNFATGGALTGPDNLNSHRPSDDSDSDLTGIVLPGIETQV
ncbi:MAG: SGNH/GDSL hydrolase family protein, partial [Geminicoccaceae bacterium]